MVLPFLALAVVVPWCLGGISWQALFWGSGSVSSCPCQFMLTVVPLIPAGCPAAGSCPAGPTIAGGPGGRPFVHGHQSGSEVLGEGAFRCRGICGCVSRRPYIECEAGGPPALAVGSMLLDGLYGGIWHGGEQGQRSSDPSCGGTHEHASLRSRNWSGRPRWRVLPLRHSMARC